MRKRFLHKSAPHMKLKKTLLKIAGTQGYLPFI
jgi:hypothetical protein